MSEANCCFVCGPDNPLGLRLKFRLEGERCVAHYLPEEHLCGWQGLVHGGILFSLLDDVMANLLLLRGEEVFTARCDIRYRAPLPMGVEILLEGRELSRRGRLIRTAGRVIRRDEGATVAEAEATFMSKPQAQT